MTPVWDVAVAGWVAAHIPGCERGFGECRALGVIDGEGEICAGVVFHDWSPERGLIELSIAATDRRWFTRDVIETALGYAFRVSRMVVCRTSEHNRPVRRMMRALNGVEYKIPDLWAPGEAGIIMTLLPGDWRRSRLGPTEHREV